MAWRISFRVALVAFVAFAVTLDNEFVQCDDLENYVRNPGYQGLGLKQFYWAWTTFRLGVYQPLSWMLAEVEYAVSGVSARAYHLTSVFLHTACAVVLYILTFTLLSCCQVAGGLRRPRENSRFVASGLVTALFMVHPLRVETVAWASAQAYLPCALFAMLSILCYLRAHGGTEAQTSRSTSTWLATSIVLYAASLLSKAASLGLPAVLLIVDVYPLRRLGSGEWTGIGRSRWRVWLEKIPYFVLSVIFGVLAVAAKRSNRMLADLAGIGIMGRFAIAAHSTWIYLLKTFWPVDLHAFPLRPEPLDWTQPRYVLSMVGLIVVSALLYRYRRQYPGCLAAWLAYLVLLAPMSGLITYGRQVVGDRFTYVAMVPWVALAAAGLCQWWARADAGVGGQRTRHATVLAGLVWMAILMVLTWAQCKSWAHSGALWAHALKHGASDFGALHNQMGIWRAMDGDLDGAVAELKQAVSADPTQAEFFLNLASAFVEKGEFDKAVSIYRIASWRWPKDINVCKQFRDTLRRAGRHAEASDQDTMIGRLRNRSDEINQARVITPVPRS